MLDAITATVARGTKFCEAGAMLTRSDPGEGQADRRGDHREDSCTSPSEDEEREGVSHGRDGPDPLVALEDGDGGQQGHGR